MLSSRGTESTIAASCLVQLLGSLCPACIGQHICNLTKALSALPRKWLAAVILELQLDFAAIVVVNEASERKANAMLAAHTGTIEQNALKSEWNQTVSRVIACIEMHSHFGREIVSDTSEDELLLAGSDGAVYLCEEVECAGAVCAANGKLRVGVQQFEFNEGDWFHSVCY
jgi:hypothetical protein